MTAPRFTIRDGARPMATVIPRPREGRVDLDSHGHAQALSGEEAVRVGLRMISAGEAVIAARSYRGDATDRPHSLAFRLAEIAASEGIGGSTWSGGREDAEARRSSRPECPGLSSTHPQGEKGRTA